jgi:5-methylcytosine-specific restriction endonuclease McrA
MVHTPETQERAYQKTRQRRKLWISILGPCKKCGSTERLELDHIDPATKISHNIWSWREERLIAELKKCQVLCYRCHKLKTINENTKSLKHGTSNGYYKKKCKCRKCLKFKSEEVKKWRKK